MKTRELSLFSIVFSLWFFAMLFEIGNLPVTSFALALLIRYLGWKRVLLYRVFFSCLCFLFNPMLLVFSYYNPIVAIYIFYQHFYLLLVGWLAFRNF